MSSTDLMTVVKEARAEAEKTLEPLLKELKISGGQLNLEADFFKRLSEKTESVLKPYYEKVKDQVGLPEFINLVVLDMQYNFIGGAIVKKGQRTFIDITDSGWPELEDDYFL